MSDTLSHSVTLDGTYIGGIRYLDIHDGFIFTCVLPASPGRSRKARPLDAVIKSVKARFKGHDVQVTPRNSH